MEKALLEINHLHRSFGGLQAVNDVSFSVVQGIVKSLIGPNGAGKSTLFNLVAGNIPADSGTVFFGGRKISGLKDYEIARHGIARTFQTTKLFHNMTVLENVMLGRHIRTKAGFIAALLNLPRTWKEEAGTRKRASAILESFGLAELAEETAVNLPFGKQRLVEIARGLAAEPQLLMLDEPAAGLNIYETGELEHLILQIKEQWGVTILLVEHDISLVMNISDEIVVLDRGRKLAEGLPAEIQKNAEVIKVYLGEDYA